MMTITTSHMHDSQNRSVSGMRPGSGFASLLKLSWRSLFRQRRRTALLIAVVAYATLAILFFWGLTDGFLNSIFNGQARLVTAPVVITAPAYHEDPDPIHALPADGFELEAVLAHPGVQFATPRLDVPGLLRSPYTSVGTLLRGVDPAGELSISDLPSAIREGRFLEQTGEMVLGTGLAATLDVRVGERLAVDASSLAGPVAKGLIVVGIIDSGIEVVDDFTTLVHLDDARELSGVTTMTALALDVAQGREAVVAQELNLDLPNNVRAYGILDQMGELATGLAAERIQMIPIGLLFSLFAAIAVTSSLVVSVMERTREFGVMLSLGLDHRRLGLMVTLEAILGSLLGFVLGLAMGFGLLYWLQEVNILGPLFSTLYGDFLQGLAIGTDIRAEMRFEYISYAIVTVVLAAVFAIITPARRVARLIPAEAMRAAE